MNLSELQTNYIYSLFCEIPNIISKETNEKVFKRALQLIEENKVHLVDHKGLGTHDELDGAGAYLHHIFRGDDIRKWFPELVTLYYALLPLISWVTCTKTVLSPYPDSDINIKAYPPGGGTVGWHFDTNAITALVYLTNNSEAPLEMEIKMQHPSKPDWVEKINYYSKEGTLFLMQGRKVWHQSKPTEKEYKMVAVLNYYTEDDLWRPTHFDKFVYEGKK